MEEIRRKPDGYRFCFVCRKRRDFVRVVTAPVIPEHPTIDDLPYYGPSTRIECTACRTMDGDCFPGTEREWSDA